MDKECKYCGKPLSKDKTFCNNSCAAKYNNVKRGPRSAETREKIKASLKVYVQSLPPTYRICKTCGKTFEVGRRTNGRKMITQYCSKECRNKFLSDINKELGSGGFREGSVKNYKSGWFNGIHCDSSWELAFLIWHRDHNISVSRCTETRTYEIDGVTHRYFPDFVVDGKIYEIKGIDDRVNQAKHRYNQDVIFLYKKDLKKYIQYAKEHYGNFIDLYDIKDKE